MAETTYILPGEWGGIPRPAFPPLVRPPGPGGSVLAHPRPPETIPPAPLPAPERPPGPPPGPSWCLGAELGVCGEGDGTPLFGNLGGPGSHAVCRALMNTVCLVTGIFIVLALLGVSLNALLRSS